MSVKIQEFHEYPSSGYQIPEHLPHRLAISFWIMNWFYGIKKGDYFHDLEKCFVELRERGFNSIRVDSGAGLTHDIQGRPRGEIFLRGPFLEYSRPIRQQNFLPGGCHCDVMKRLIELFTLAKQYDVYVILSSWFYLHTFWFVEDNIRGELFSLLPEKRFMHFAKSLDRIIDILKEKDLHRWIAFAEIQNEADGIPFLIDEIKKDPPDEELERIHKYRQFHEEALDYLKDKHPDILFALDTYHPYVNEELIPRNMQVWNMHSYYIWPIYHAYEGNLLEETTDLSNPQNYAFIDRFLRKPLASLDDIKKTQGCDLNVMDNWYRRVWLYYNTNPAMVPELDQCLSKDLDRDIGKYKERAYDAITHAEKIRQAKFPGIPMVMSEGPTYCAHTAMRWEEKSEAYWSLIEYNTKLLREYRYWGCVPRTNSGPEDPAWMEFPDQLRHINRLFLDDNVKRES
jgi:hypothetical protein